MSFIFSQISSLFFSLIVIIHDKKLKLKMKQKMKNLMKRTMRNVSNMVGKMKKYVGSVSNKIGYKVIAN